MRGRTGQGSRANGVPKPVGNRYTCIRGYAHAYHFLDVGGIKVLRCLPGITARDKEIDAGIHAPIEERPNQCTAKLLHRGAAALDARSEEHTSELQSLRHLVCRLLLEKKNNN